MMLTQAEQREIEALLEVYPTRQAAMLDAMQIVQRRKRWVSDEDLCAVAALMELAPAELDSVATFYSQIFRRPVGEHIIRLCDGVSCWIMDGTDLKDHLRRLLGIREGETTPDGRFTWLPVSCLGVCEQAPAMMLDDALHTRLTPERLTAIVQPYLQQERH